MDPKSETRCEICETEFDLSEDEGWYETDTGDLCEECASELEYQPELDD